MGIWFSGTRLGTRLHLLTTGSRYRFDSVQPSSAALIRAEFNCSSPFLFNIQKAGRGCKFPFLRVHRPKGGALFIPPGGAFALGGAP